LGQVFSRIKRFPARETPFSWLVPIVRLASAALLLDEGLSPTQLLSAVLVFGGWLRQRLLQAAR
jgi:O-acetylserine/cysteine efflux transporter